MSKSAKTRKPTKAERQQVEDGVRGEMVRRTLVRQTLLLAIRPLTFDQLVEAWWEAQARR